jgi:hypothetical protein
VRRAAWIWATLEALAAAVCSGPTAAFLAPFAVELGAGGGQLGLLLGLTTLLTNVLQLQGAQWTRRGRTDRRLYLSAFLARASWLAAGAVPAALVGAGRADVAFLAFLAAVAVSSVATTASGPVMAARAATASGAWRRGGAPPNRVTATWLGALLGAGGMIALLIWRPGVSGYAAGYAAAGAIGLLGLLPYTLLVRQAPQIGRASGRERVSDIV